MSADSLMTIYGDDGPSDLYFRGRLVASGSHAAMRAASRLLTGQCEAKPASAVRFSVPFPFELIGHQVRYGSDSVVVPPFRQEYDLHFVPDETTVTRDELDALAKEVYLREGHARASQLFGVRTGRTYAIPAVRAVDTVAPLHNDDEPGQ